MPAGAADVIAACCGPGGGSSEYGTIFGARIARSDANRYRRRGLRGTAAQLADWLRPAAPGATVLEVGGGIGAIQVELLRAGASQARNVELSPEYEETAALLARSSGVDARVERSVGDFTLGELPPPADLVVLHRVVCCHPDLTAMMGRAAGAARQRLAVTYPRDRWWVRVPIRLLNGALRLRGRTFRVFVHHPEAIAALATAGGLEVVERRAGLVWESILAERR